MDAQRVYFDRVDSKWRIKGYEEYHFSTEEDAQTAREFAVAYAPDMVAEMTGGFVDIGPSRYASKKAEANG